MGGFSGAMDGLATLDSLSVAVLTDDVSDNYVSKTPFAVSEFANVVREGATVISGEALLVVEPACPPSAVRDEGDRADSHPP